MTLFKRIESFLEKNPEVGTSTIGRAAVGDPGLYNRLKDGRAPRETTVATVEKWMTDYNAKKRAAKAAEIKRRKRAADKAHEGHEGHEGRP